jgi:hypothetical protein
LRASDWQSPQLQPLLQLAATSSAIGGRAMLADFRT